MCRSASTCRCAGSSSAIGAPDRRRAARRDRRTRARGARHARRSRRRRHLVGGLLRRPGPRRDRPRRQVLLNPTNGASYTGTLLQTQQIASSRLRALETGRWVAQVAPTGFTAFIDDTGHVKASAPGSASARCCRWTSATARATRSTCAGATARRARRAAARRDRPHRGSSSSKTVTGPSLTSSTAIVVRNRPVATRRTELDASAATTASTSGSATSGGAAREPRRATALARVAVERELAHDEHLGARVGDRSVHHAVVVGEHPQVDDALGQLARGCVVVVVGDADEHAEARADLADDLAVDGDLRSRDPLHQRAHGGRTLRCAPC